MPKAYPVYDGDYRDHLDVVPRLPRPASTNLQTVGRNGMHRYNNQDHSMLTGMLAARNLLGEQHDLWDVNTERSYHEEQQSRRNARADVPPALRVGLLGCGRLGSEVMLPLLARRRTFGSRSSPTSKERSDARTRACPAPLRRRLADGAGPSTTWTP